MRRMLALIAAGALLLPMMSFSALSRNLTGSNERSPLQHERNLSGAQQNSTTPAPVAAPLMPVITATKTDFLLIDNDNDNNADTGDTLRYTVTITNSGSMDALGVMFNDTVDANTTLDNGSIKTTPLAINDSYAASGNIRISIGAGGGVLANDNDPDGGSLSASAGATSANGGNVSMNPDGSFTYNPPPGFEGTDTFNYTVTDADGNTDTATVSVTVSGMIWFVDNTAGAGGDGRLTSPYNCLTGAGCFSPAAPDDPGDNIFIYTGGGNYTGGLTLLAGQRLIGQGAGQSLSTITGITPPSGSDPLPSTGGLSPVIVSATNGVNLGTNNLVRGLNIGNTGGSGLSGTGFGLLTVREVEINGTGQSLNLNLGTLDTVFTKLYSLNSPAQGISLTNVSGSLTSGPTDVDSSTGAGLIVTGADANLDFGATTVIGTGGTGVNLTSNSGNIIFSALNITPDAGQRGLLANGNNTGTITSTSGTINASVATAVEVNGISPANRTDLNLTLTSVSTDLIGTGIALQNTAGTFTVTGSGTTAGSGGTLQNIISRGASFIDSDGISLSNMNFINVGTVNGDNPLIATSTCGSLVTGNNTGCNAGLHMVNVTGASFTNLVMNGGAQQGINGNNVTNFSLANSQVINFGNETRENGIQFKGLFGTSSVTNTVADSNEADQMLVHNSSGLLTSLTVSGSSFMNSIAPNGNNGLTFSGDNTANMSVVVQNSTFSGNRVDGFSANSTNSPATNTAAMSINISGSTFQNHGNAAINVVTNGGSNTTFNISNNPVITGSAGSAININNALPSTGTLQGTLANNVIGTSGVPNSGAIGGAGINAVSNGSGALTVAMTNNVIQGMQFGSGINIQARDGNNSLNATVTGNTIDLNSATALNGILVNSGGVSTDTVNLCADINTNNIANSPSGDEIRVRRRFAGVTFRLPGFAGVGTTLTDVNNFLAAQNTLNGGTVSSTNAGAPGFVGGAPCTAPSARMMQKGGASEHYARRMSKPAPERKPSARSDVREKSAGTLIASRSLHHAPAKTNRTRAEKAKLSSSTAPRAAASALVGSVNLNIGTLPAGKSITITFNVQINNSVPSGTTQVSNQGTVSGSNFADVLTDDPDAPGAADPTVTPIQASTPPTISCPAPITETAPSGSCSKSVSFSVTATGSPDPTVDCKIGSTSITSPHIFPVGTTTVTCTASNGAPPDASCSFTVTIVDPDAPVITMNGPNPMVVECGSTFNDPGATANDLCAGPVPVSSSNNVNTSVPGTYSVTYTATDGTNTANATRTVIVVDTGAPVINLNGQSLTLWPPNHQYVTVNISQFVVSASDGCDGSIDINDVVISKVTSDETENGNGDGNTFNDIVIASNCKSVQLRSERNGGGNGRVYTIHFRVTDSQGNVATATAKVKVPKSQGNNGGAVEDAPQYTVNSSCP